MRKQVFGRKLKRDKNERKALFKGLMSSLVHNGRITTTQEKAKAIKGEIDKLITKAKKKGNAAVNDLSPYLTPEASKKLITEIVPKNAQRNSGYTRIIRVEKRLKDSAQMVVMEWVEAVPIENSKMQIENRTLDKKKEVAKKENTKVRVRNRSVKESKPQEEEATKK